MKLPRRGILIRLLIFGPLLLYFGKGALDRYLAERQAEDQATELESTKRKVTLPDGSQHDVYELTPEQAERLLGQRLPPSMAARNDETTSAANPPAAPAAPTANPAAPTPNPAAPPANLAAPTPAPAAPPAAAPQRGASDAAP